MEYSENNTDQSLIEYKHALAKLQYQLHIEEEIWRQKANLKFNLEGDSNTKYFHSIVKGRRIHNCIHRIKNEQGIWIEDHEEIKKHIVDFYTNQLSQEGYRNIPDSFLENIPTIVNPSDNETLVHSPTELEIKNAIWEMNGSSAAGPDGYTGMFYQQAWDIVKNEVVGSIQEFFSGKELTRAWTCANIVLIPKTKRPEVCGDLRPISLSNFNQKIISKVLSNRVRNILPRIICPNQTGFVKGRNITDNILLAQEIVQNIDAKCRGGNVVFKLDMAKAYDRVDWLVLTKVLRKFGFHEKFIDMVYRLVNNCYYSVIINGTGNGFFKATRGLKQGDPLSPALFIIMAEVLSRGLNNLMDTGKVQAFTQPIGTHKISHLSFADDILIFSNAGKRNIKNIMKYLTEYQRWTGQLINVNKSNYYTGKKMKRNSSQQIHEVTGFKKGEMPFMYLGCPIFSGKTKIEYFTGLLEKIKGRIQGWQTNLLNQAGKLILIAHVLQSIPLHIIAACDPPKTIIKEIDKLMASCFWRNKDSKHHWIKWKNCCRTKEEGGLGIKRMKDIITTQSLKLYWKLLTGDSLWTKFMRIKYCNEIDNSQHSKSITSTGWRRIRNIRELADQFIDYSEFRYKWKMGNTGDFQAKATWNIIREKHAENLGKYIWNIDLAKRISIFLWKVIHRRLPVDENVKKLGVHMASKCQCCDHTETMEHILATGSFAKEVWKHFMIKAGIRRRGSNITETLQAWWSKTRPGSAYSAIFHVIPSLIAWEIWRSRCKSRYEEAKVSVPVTIENIQQQIKMLIQKKKKKKRANLNEAILLKMAGINE